MMAPAITPRSRDSRLLLSLMAVFAPRLCGPGLPHGASAIWTLVCRTLRRNAQEIGAENRGGDEVTTDVEDEVAEGSEGAEGDKSLFGRGVLFGLVGGALVAILLISVGGSVVSLVDDVFGSEEAEAAPAEELTGEALLIATGQDLATTNGCIGCHSVNGLDGAGPTWSGLAARVDTDYLRRAILEPNADIATGFAEGIMPLTYADSLSAEDIDALVAYIQSL